MAMRIVLAVSLSFLSACSWFTTKHEGSEMRKRIDALDTRMAKQEASVDVKVRQLDESLDKAAKFAARNSADLGAEFDKLLDELRQLRGIVEQARRDVEASKTELAETRKVHEETVAGLVARIDALEKKPPAPSPPADPMVLFDQGVSKLNAGQPADARNDLRAFLARSPSHARAAEAQLYLGRTFVREKEYEKAIAEYQRVVDKYQSSDFVDDALYAAGEAALEKKWCVDSRAYFGEVVRRFPSSPLAKDAETKLAYIKKNLKNKKVCSV